MLPAAGNVAEQASLTQAQPSARERWEQTLRGRPLATDDFASGAFPQPKIRALQTREIAPDPDGWVRAIRHDLDRDDAVFHVRALVESGELPAPSYIVENPRTGHAHVVWELGRWVRTDSMRAVRFLERVRGALREIVGADRAYVGKFQHNPLHSDFQTWGDWRTSELGDLARALGDRLWIVTTNGWSRSTAQVDEQNVVLGRNCSHFEHVRIAAYKLVDYYRQTQDEAGFTRRVRELVDAANSTETDPLGERECAGIARSITRWTWNVYRRGPASAQAHRTQTEQTRDEYLRAQSLARREARRYRAAGLGATAIAKRLDRSRSWVYIALSEVEAVSEQTVQSPPLSGFVHPCASPVAIQAPEICRPVSSLEFFLARRSSFAAAAFVAARSAMLTARAP